MGNETSLPQIGVLKQGQSLAMQHAPPEVDNG